MSYLIDTCTFLWFVTDDKNLSANAKALIEGSDTAIYELIENGFVPLEITISHIKKVAVLPAHHNDPFDRLVIAQSLIEDFTVVTNDRQFDNYEMERYW